MTNALKRIFGTKKNSEEKQSISIAGAVDLEDVAGTKLGNSNTAGLWGFVTDLNGYDYLETNIVTDKNIKTLTGATLTFTEGNQSFILQSDMNEIEGEPLLGVKAYLSRISFDIDKAQIKQFNNKTFDTIVLSYKKKEIIFSKA